MLKLMVDRRASDLHMRVPSPPVMRIDGVLTPQEDLPPLNAKNLELVFECITNPEQRSLFLKEKEMDFAYSVPGLARFRASVMLQRGTISIAFRLVPFDVQSIDELGMPQALKNIVTEAGGLILISGSGGSGKSTTLAALVNHLNQNEKRNIITIENPIEYLHKNNKCIIAQRDIGDDTKSLTVALENAMHHDPDVIVLDEIYDADTISTAIRAAETGRLVIGALYAADAIQTVERVLEVFSDDKQAQFKARLAKVLKAAISQKLLNRSNGGRVAAFEILETDDEARRMIKEGRMQELAQKLEAGGDGNSCSMYESLAALVKEGIVSEEEAAAKSNSPHKLKEKLSAGK